jgi:hypothetical protein
LDSNYVNKSKGCQSCVLFTNGILDINDVNVRYYHSHANEHQVQGISDNKNVIIENSLYQEIQVSDNSKDSLSYYTLSSSEILNKYSYKRENKYNEKSCIKYFSDLPNFNILHDLASNGIRIFQHDSFVYDKNFNIIQLFT